MKEPPSLQKTPPTFIVNLIGQIRILLLSAARKISHPNMEIMEMVQGFWIAKSVGVASSLGIADLLEEKQMGIEELANKTQTNQANLYRLLRMLASRGVFREEKNKHFSNTRLSRALIDSPLSMKYMVEHQLNPNNWSMMGELGKSIKNGKGANQYVLGESIFEHLKKHPDLNSLYNKAMTNTSLLLASTVTKAYTFKGINKIVDLGGGQGELLTQILHKYPKVNGVVFDLPHVIEDIKSEIKDPCSGQLTFQAGDIFQSVPESDTYMLKNVLHAFDDSDCIKILNNISDAAKPNAKILILEPLIGKRNKPSFGKLFDVQLIAGTNGGCERTKAEYKKIIGESKLGFKRIVPTISPFSIIEAEKN